MPLPHNWRSRFCASRVSRITNSLSRPTYRIVPTRLSTKILYSSVGAPSLAFQTLL